MRGRRNRQGVYRFVRTWSRMPFLGYVSSLLPLGLGAGMLRAAWTRSLGEGVTLGEAYAWSFVVLFTGLLVVALVSMARIYELSSERLNMRSRMGLGRRQSFLWSDIRGFRLESYNWGTRSSRTSRHRRLYVILRDGSEQVIDDQIDHTADIQGVLSALRSRGYRIEQD